MTTLEIAGMALATEFALVALGILFMLRRRRRHATVVDTVGAGAMEQEIEAKEPSRREALASLFKTTYQLRGRALSAKVDEYIAREKAFYSAMLSIYLNRDGEKLKDIPNELLKVLSPLVELGTELGTAATDTAEVDTLHSENARLTTELESTKQTIAQLLDEYNAAFNKGVIPTAKAAKAPAPVQEQASLAVDDFDSLLTDADGQESSAATGEDAAAAEAALPDEDEIEQKMEDLFDKKGKT